MQYMRRKVSRMIHKGKKVIAWLLLAVMLLSMPGGEVYAEDIPQTSEEQSDIKVEETQNNEVTDQDNASENNSSNADENVVSAEEPEEVEENISNQDQTQTTDQPVSNSSEETTADFTQQGLINYVGIDFPYLETPAEQNIVISYGDGTENVSEAKVIVNKNDGSVLEISLSKKEGELFMFTNSFDETATGVYELMDFVYVQDGIEQTIHLADTGIKAMFGVNEEYPGYNEPAEVVTEDVSEQEVEMSVVDVKSGNIEETATGIEDAIQATEEKVGQAQKSRASRTAATQKDGNLVVVLDPGHGGKDSGAVGVNGVYEKNLTLKIAQYCKAELEQYNGVTVYMTRTDDTYPGGTGDAAADLDNRVAYAKNKGADVLVSIHLNSTGTGSANGAEVYFPNSSYRPEIGNEGMNLAQKVHDELVSLGIHGRGIKIRNTENGSIYPDGSPSDYYGLIYRAKKAELPAIIIEHAFIDNPSDYNNFLSSDEKLQKLGIADATGIAKTYGLSKGASIRVEHKNDFAGNAQINVTGIGNNGKVKIWNEETGALKEYTLATGKQTIDFNVAEYNNARGTFYVEALDSSGQSLLKETFYVSKDTSSTITIDSGGTETKYVVDIKFADMPKEVIGVQVPVWTKTDQSDLKWLNAKQVVAGEWQATFNIQDYKVGGMYNVHAYVQLEDGTQIGIASRTTEVTKPSFSGEVLNYSEEAGTFEVVISEINSPSGVDMIQVPVWCADDQSDLIWYNAEKQSDGTYKIKVSIANHGYAIGAYKINVYLTAGNGIVTGKNLGDLEVSFPKTEICVENIGNRETQYCVEVSNVELTGSVKNVMFAVWSEQGGQDDLVWYTGRRDADGNWEATIDIRDHKTAGKYEVDAYATLANGVMRGLGARFFEVSAPGFTASVENYKEEDGTFEVIISNIEAPSGVEKVQVPVWCAADQSDIKWYDAEEQEDGSYKIKASIANHSYSVGAYQAHVYLTTKNGLSKGMVTEGQQVVLPQMEINVKDTTGMEMTYQAEATNVGMLGVLQNVMFAVWSEQGGQDDLVWYTGRRDADGNWEATIDIRDHKTAGKYEVDAYATLANGVMRGLGARFFEVKGASLTSAISIKDYNESTGEFTVSIPEPLSLSGIDSVLVPVWCSEDQSDICWYAAEKKQNRTYEVKVNPVYHNYHSGLYKIHVYVNSKNGIQQNVGISSQMVSATQYYTIMGDTTVSLEQMVELYKKSSRVYPSTVLGNGGAATIEQFCQIYLEEAKAEGVRAEVAFAQAMNETGWLQYGGIVKIEQYNFAGIGAIDGNAVGNCASFPNVRIGVRAQIQHLKAYGSTDGLNNPCVDPRFNYVRRGVAPYVEWLGINENPSGIGWASADKYGYSIVSMIRNMKNL